MRIGTGLQIDMAAGASPLTAVWLTAATPTNASRTSFGDDTVLLEFGWPLATAAPELEDPIQTSLTLMCGGTVVVGSYTDEQGLTCSLSGTFTPSTGAVALTGSGGDFALTIALTLSAGVLSGSYPTGGITVARNASGSAVETRDVIAARGSAVTLTGSEYYLDGRAGNDGNDGRTPATPKLTLASLKTAAGGAWSASDVICVACGTRVREWIDARTGANAGITVQAYGVGPRPILDGADVLVNASFASLGGGTPNVFAISVTPEVDESTGSLIPLEDGIALITVADDATCQATPGSFVASLCDGVSGTYPLHLHPRGSTNPTIDGKLYESSSRGCVFARGSTTVRGITGRCSILESGAIVVQQDQGGAAGTYVDELLYDCVGLWTHKHAFFLHAGTAAYCRAIGFTEAGKDIAPFVLNRDVASGEDVAHTDCAVIQWPSLADSGMGFGTGTCHKNTSGLFGDVTFTRLYQAFGDSGYGFTDVGGDVLYEDGVFENPRGQFQGVAVTACNSYTVRRMRFYAHVVGDTDQVRAVSVNVGDVLVEDSLITTKSSSNGCIGVVSSGTTNPGTATVRRNMFLELNKVSFTCALDSSGTPNADIQFVSGGTLGNGNIIYNISRPYDMDGVGSAIIAPSDYNVVYPGTVTTQETPAATPRAFTVYQGDQAVLDQNSSVTLPTFLAGGITGDRPTGYQDTVPFIVGPTQCRSGGAGWTDPEDGFAWRTFLNAL